ETRAGPKAGRWHVPARPANLRRPIADTPRPSARPDQRGTRTRSCVECRSLAASMLTHRWGARSAFSNRAMKRPAAAILMIEPRRFGLHSQAPCQGWRETASAHAGRRQLAASRCRRQCFWPLRPVFELVAAQNAGLNLLLRLAVLHHA